MAAACPLIECLADLCRSHLRDEKWLLAPSRRAAHQWLDRVTLAGGPVVNVHVKTARSLAIDLIATRRAAETRSIASASARRLAIAAAWAEAVDDDGYLGSARLTPRMLAQLERTLIDLRLAGVEPAALGRGRFEHPHKGRELARLLTAYVHELERRGLIDHADTVRLAIAEVASAPPDALVLVPDDLLLAPLEAELLAAFGDRRVTLPVDAEPQAPRADLEIRHAVGEINEVRSTLRSCLAEDLPLDRVEVLYTSADPYAACLYETTLRVLPDDPDLDLGVPVTFADGVPARLSRPGRLLAAWATWIEEGFPQAMLLRMIRDGLVRLPRARTGERRGASALTRALRRVWIGFGRSRYETRLCEAIAALEAGDGPPFWLDATRELLELVTGLLAACPDPGDRALDVVRCAHELIRDHARCVSRLDALARQHIEEELDDMVDALAAERSDPRGFDPWSWLRELPQRLHVGGSSPRPGHLHVASIASGGHSGRPHTFILGLDDGRFPSRGLQDPLLLDDERRGLSGGLPTASARLHRQLEDFGRLLARLPGRTVLSFRARNVTDDSECFASPVVLAAFRLATGRADADHAALRDTLGPPASFGPLRPEWGLDAGEWWLAWAAADPPLADPRAIAAAAHPDLGRGWLADDRRDADELGVYDGRVEPDASLDPRDLEAGPVLSATRLQTLGRCPLAYFYESVLRIRSPEELEVDPNRWLDHRVAGTLLHDVLYAFVGELVAAHRWPPEYERDRSRLDAIVGEQVEILRRRIPPPNEEAYRRARRELDHACHIFLVEEAHAGPDRTPLYLEASLGMDSLGGGSVIDRAEPVEITLDDGKTQVRARARLDRIDRQGDGGRPVFSICDYKSGSYTKRYDPKDDFDQGRLLQHVLYMAVAEVVLRDHFGDETRVEAFRFFFPSQGARGRTISFGRGILPRGRGIVRTLAELAAGGLFIATDDRKADCRFCEHKPACYGADRRLEVTAERSRRKLANAGEDLAGWRALRHGG